jgi:DNA-directed RNA polymerase subunit RPC12/RpoP
MTVRIVKKKPDPSVIKRAVCKNCGATLEYVPKDVHRRDGTDYGGGPDGEEWINCPECQTKVILKSW